MVSNIKNKKIVCLGGGIGTVNLVKGLRQYTDKITIVVSMADEGGSAGRLRRLYKVLPAGDVVSCMASFSEQDSPLYAKFLTYRFPGNRYGKDSELVGHKMGNLMMVAAQEITGSFEEAIEFMKKLFRITGNIYPATAHPVSIHAKTVDGIVVKGEEKIDLGKYKGKRVLDKVYLHPANAKASEKVIKALEEADAIIAGPGDLYTTILPVLIIPEIKKILINSKKTKLFIVNVANKPFETKGYSVPDFVNAIRIHLGLFPFERVIVNDNFSLPIPNPFHYSYVQLQAKGNAQPGAIYKTIAGDLVDEDFPLYHNPGKLAKAVAENV